LPAIAGRPPDPTRRAPGCAFAPRCVRAEEHCRLARPPLTADAHQFACWRPLDVPAEAA
jgi:oligopeptide/dipeptide ABC transporter ATP-binding protein